MQHAVRHLSVPIAPVLPLNCILTPTLYFYCSYFRQSKWASFQRQLNIYGFQRLTGKRTRVQRAQGDWTLLPSLMALEDAPHKLTLHTPATYFCFIHRAAGRDRGGKLGENAFGRWGSLVATG